MVRRCRARQNAAWARRRRASGWRRSALGMHYRPKRQFVYHAWKIKNMRAANPLNQPVADNLVRRMGFIAQFLDAQVHPTNNYYSLHMLNMSTMFYFIVKMLKALPRHKPSWVVTSVWNVMMGLVLFDDLNYERLSCEWQKTPKLEQATEPDSDSESSESDSSSESDDASEDSDDDMDEGSGDVTDDDDDMTGGSVTFVLQDPRRPVHANPQAVDLTHLSDDESVFSNDDTDGDNDDITGRSVAFVSANPQVVDLTHLSDDESVFSNNDTDDGHFSGTFVASALQRTRPPVPANSAGRNALIDLTHL